MLVVLGGNPALAATVDEDPTEAKVREIAKELRCAVCQNESVYDSRSDLAVQMKELIRDRLKAGGIAGVDPKVLRLPLRRLHPPGAPAPGPQLDHLGGTDSGVSGRQRGPVCLSSQAREKRPAVSGSAGRPEVEKTPSAGDREAPR